MQEKQPQHFELETTKTLVQKLNADGFAILEPKDSFLGRLADSIKPAARRIAIPASAALLLVTAAACSQSEASINSIENSDLSVPTRISEISQLEPLRRTSPPARITEESVINLPKELELPDGIRIVIGNCASDGKCMPNHSFYWQPTEEIILDEGQRENILIHEACHAHQDWSIKNDKNHLQEDYTLKPWYDTDEGKSFAKAVEGLSWPWTEAGPETILEDFAWTCGYFYFDPHYLQKQSPDRYKWAINNLPKPELVR